jgi:hypothetical protein
MNPKDLLALLGRVDTDPLVEAALTDYAVRNRPMLRAGEDDADRPVVETQSWVKNSRAGIEFGFDDEAAWTGLGEADFGQRPMLLTQIYLYGQHERVRPYREPLPFGLRLGDNRATVRKKLDRFESTRHSYIRDTWDTPELRITVSYADGESCIGFVICMLREPPLPPLGYALAPVPSVEAIVDLLGGALDDQHMHSAFDPLGLRGRIDEIKESGEADFRRPYGFSLDFAVPDGTSNPSAKEILLLSVTFFQERDQGPRGWPGELPFAIRFGDSPETVVQKLGRLPDIQSDDEEVDFSGEATWHEPRFTVNVFYDTMENRVLRVSAIAPGLRARLHEE